ncbi:MAG TPA: hypothetical protein PLH56_03025 [Candidatus Omnitrophota bacterium]|nr:hypothetical protein [Candidatus Omnitrophota bacterium]
MKWYFKTSVLVLGFLCAGPLMLPLIWFHPRYKRFTKIVLTVIIIFISFFAVKMFLHFWNIVKDYYQVIFSGELKAF